MNSEQIAKVIVFSGIAYLIIKTLYSIVEKVTNNTVAFFASFIVLMYVANVLIDIEV